MCVHATQDLSLGALNCTRDEIYLPKRYTWADLDEFTPDPIIDQLPTLLAYLPPRLRELLLSASFTAMPIQIHAMFLALFASLIAPFGELLPRWSSWEGEGGRERLQPTRKRAQGRGRGAACTRLGATGRRRGAPPVRSAHGGGRTQQWYRAALGVHALGRRRVCRQRIQARLQAQGLWGHHPRARRHHRPL